MTEEQKTAKGILDAFGKYRGLAHIAFVLSPGFGLTKLHLRSFWVRVRIELIAQSKAREYKGFTD